MVSRKKERKKERVIINDETVVLVQQQVVGDNRMLVMENIFDFEEPRQGYVSLIFSSNHYPEKVMAHHDSDDFMINFHSSCGLFTYFIITLLLLLFLLFQLIRH
jgi:ABC-type uncharacterized transport system involved in gliding motility auxiliary subunit